MEYSKILALILFFSFKGFSQIPDSLFTSYKNQDLRIRQLDFAGSLGANNMSSTLVNGNTGLFRDVSELLFGGDLALNYSKFINRAKLQSDYTSNVGLRQSRSRNYYSSDFPLDNNSSIILRANNKTRYYPTSEFFYGLGYNLFYGFDYSHKDDFFETNRIVKTSDHNLNIEIPLSIGIGRKYPVYSVHKSMWIYSELQKNHSLTRAPGDQEIEQLAHLIDDNEYTRFFDSRYKRIQDLGRVDSILTSQHIIGVQNINYFTTIYDMYYYSSGTNRFRGKFIEGGISSEYYYYQSKLTDSSYTSKTIYKAFTPVLFAEYRNFKPINLYWQFDYGIRAEYGLNSIVKGQKDQYGSGDNRVRLSGNASLIYFPNTRSYLNLNLMANYGNTNLQTLRYFGPYSEFVYYNDYYYLYPLPFFYRDYQYELNYTKEYKTWLTILQLNHYYYISPQFRTQSSLSLSYTDNDSFYSTKNKIKANFKISFSYSLF